MGIVIAIKQSSSVEENWINEKTISNFENWNKPPHAESKQALF